MTTSRGSVSNAWSLLAAGAVIVLAAAAQVWPTLASSLEFDRAAVAGGQVWRLLTCHLTHYGWMHMAVNLAAFSVLAWIAAGRSRRWSVVATAAGLAVGAGVLLLSDVPVYRGISGVTCGLLGWVLVTMAMQSSGMGRLALLAVLAIAVGKFIVEMIIGRNLLPTSAPDGVAVIHVIHVIGLLVGAALAAGGAVSRMRLIARQQTANW